MSQHVPESLMNGIGGLSGSGPAFVSCHRDRHYYKKMKTVAYFNSFYSGISHHRSISGRSCENGCAEANGD